MSVIRSVATTASAVGLIAGMTAFATTALAHHPMGGETPATLVHGLLSGIGHPIIGIDHLAFVIAIGLVAAYTRIRALLPLAFVMATVAGCGLIVAGFTLPAAEIVITASVVLLGIVAMLGRVIATPILVALLAASGLFHGWAYGEAIVGAETTPLVAYLFGFAVTQFAIASGVAWGVVSIWKALDASALQPRLAGAMVAGVGLALLIETVEGMIFA